ncbi:MAG TPA: hypothetical protein VGF09_07405, partial [Solirubrobacterales bacterium]
MATFDALADLPLEVDGYELEGLEFKTGEFERLTTVIHLEGAGEEGLGEDVIYEPLEHIALQEAGPYLDLTGHATLGEFCEFMGGVDAFPQEPGREVSRRYRRYAFEAAALDLALRQGRIGISAALGRDPQPVNFVCSMRLSPGEGRPSTIETLRRKLDPYPTLRFKLDPTNDWDDDLIAELVATGAVDSLDLKGFYKGTPVDVETDPELYAKLIEAFPDAWLEDPDVNDETRPILDPASDRVTWDAPIHSIADIQELPFQPKMVNIKPSRFGRLRELFDGYDYCDAHGIGAYGGGQFELGVGRGHIQYLASL